MFEEMGGFRHEYKYIEPDVSLMATESRMKAVMKRDEHVGSSGFYQVRSVYFDDYRNTYLRQNIDGVDERVKWRIRIYDRNSNHITLERKLRKSDLVRKQACLIDAETYNKIVNRQVKINSSQPELLNMFMKEIKIYRLIPTTIVEYDRTPFVCSFGNVRVTIDRNIRISLELDDFLSDRRLDARPVLETGKSLIEVKYDTFLPDYIAHAVEHGRMRRETFSKYYLARKFSYVRRPYEFIR